MNEDRRTADHTWIMITSYNCQEAYTTHASGCSPAPVSTSSTAPAPGTAASVRTPQ